MMKKIIICLVLLCAVMWTPEVAAQEAVDSVSGNTIGSVSGGEAADGETPTGTEAGTAAAEPTDTQIWDAACAAYANNDFRRAAEGFEQLIARGLSSAKLYYNLGNAYFKEDDLGHAILYYHRALRLDPGVADYRYNLEVAESHTKDNIEKVPEFFLGSWLRAVRRMMSCTAWSILSLVFLAGALVLFLNFLLAQRLVLRKVGFYGTMLAGLCFVVTTWLAVGERREMLDRSQAVVMSASVAVKSSPDKSATDLFVLHEGTTLRIENRLDGWCEVTIADGKKGWLEERKIEEI